MPGEPTDYHFAIQSCHGEIWNRHRDEPEVLPTLERFCWLDIHLIEAVPDAFADERDGKRTYYAVTAFRRLIDLYEREGFLHEALDVALRAARFDQAAADVERLQERLARLEAEDAT